MRNVLTLFALVSLMITRVEGQLSTATITRESQFHQSGPVPVHDGYWFIASAQGTLLRNVTVASPATVVQLVKNATYFQYNTNFADTNYIDNPESAGLDVIFPVGTYHLTVDWTETHPPSGVVIARTTGYEIPLANDFPTLVPIITNIQPPGPLASSQVFIWPAFPADSGISVEFALYESPYSPGQNPDPDAVGNFKLIPPGPQTFDWRTNSINYDRLDSTKAHLVVLGFYQTDFQSTEAPYLGSFSSVVNSIMFNAAPPPVSIVILGETAVISWPATSGDLYRLYETTDFINWAATPSASVQGANYLVNVSLVGTTRFFRLQSP